MALLRDGINSQLDPDAVQPEARPNGRVARRKAAYFAAVAAGSDPRSRLRERDTPAAGMVAVGAARV
jgi:RNA polymerase sigma factor for flagellar operon FliA